MKMQFLCTFRILALPYGKFSADPWTCRVYSTRGSLSIGLQKRTHILPPWGITFLWINKSLTATACIHQNICPPLSFPSLNILWMNQILEPLASFAALTTAITLKY
jgi:hypothetical protein